MPDFDLVVVGTGAGGLTAAAEAKKRGISVALVEKDRPGGDCSYYGCVPTKTLIQTAKVLHTVRRAHEFGLPKIEIEPDFAEVMAHKSRIVDEITAKGSFEPWREAGFEVFQGTGRFTSNHEVAVDGKTVRGEKLVVAVGTEPAVPLINGLSEAGYITNVQAVALKSLPKRVAVLGAGPLGIEFSQILTRFGSQVTVIEMMDQILPNEDEEVAGRLQGYLEEEGVTIHVRAMVKRVEKKGPSTSLRTGDQKVVIAEGENGEFRVEADEILVAAGRRPQTSDLGLENAGVETEERGWVKVDETLRTTAPNIWAAGDCTGKYLFTHIADYHGRLIAHNMFSENGSAIKADHSIVPWATFTDPELAHVGLTERDAEAKGIEVRTAKMDVGDVERAQMMLERKGMIKVVTDRDTKILGATILGPHADDLIHEFAIAIKAGMKSHDILSMIHAYPTLSEAVRWSLWGLENEGSTGV
jgi:mercury(II) reductase